MAKDEIISVREFKASEITAIELDIIPAAAFIIKRNMLAASVRFAALFNVFGIILKIKFLTEKIIIILKSSMSKNYFIFKKCAIMSLLGIFINHIIIIFIRFFKKILKWEKYFSKNASSGTGKVYLFNVISPNK
jgi:uncharacterized membrane protein